MEVTHFIHVKMEKGGVWLKMDNTFKRVFALTLSVLFYPIVYI
jgi:hypothetical protein